MDHIGNGPHQVDRVEHHNRLRAVGHTDGDLVAGPDSNIFQRLGARMYLRDKFGICRGPAHKIEGNVLRVLLGDRLHQFKHGAFKIRKMRGNITVIGKPRGFHFHHVLLLNQAMCTNRTVSYKL